MNRVYSNNMPDIPTNKSTQAVAIIKELIFKGEWQNHLPSERVLAKQLMMSRACLRQALEKLTLEGVLAPPEPSKRRQIAKIPNVDKMVLSGKQKVIFFTPESPHSISPMVYEQVAKLREFLAKSDIYLEILSSTIFQHENTSFGPLERIMEDYPNGYWILHQCPHYIQEWFDSSSIPSCILGSPFPGIKIPSFGYDFRGAARHAAGKLLSLGHKRIALIRFRSQLAGDDSALIGIEEAIETSMTEGVHPPVVMTHNFHVDRLTTSLDALYQSNKPPTAFIIVNHHHFLTAFSHLLSRGISIPKQVSLISLTNHATLACLSPKPACYSNSDRVLKRVANLIINRSNEESTEATLITPELSPGKTIAKPLEE